MRSNGNSNVIFSEKKEGNGASRNVYKDMQYPDCIKSLLLNMYLHERIATLASCTFLFYVLALITDW